MRILHTLTALLVLGLAASHSAEGQARKQIRVTGSSTLYPFATAVAEEFGRSTKFDAPVVEGIGSGGGFKLFCSGVGTNFPDVVNSSRRIKRSEYQKCFDNGVIEIVEIKVGYDGIVFANSRNSPPLTLSLRHIYLALAREIPKPGTDGGPGSMIANPNTRWSDIDPALPDREILVLGPPPTSGTRDTLNEQALEMGCSSFKGLALLLQSDPDLHRQLCYSIREDGRYVDSGENDNLIVQKLQANIDAVGIFGFSFLDQNSDLLQPAKVRHKGQVIMPSFDTIVDKQYPVYRTLYLYAKKAHVAVIPGIQQFLQAFTSDEAVGEYGYLIDRGLIPLEPGERELASRTARELLLLTSDDLR